MSQRLIFRLFILLGSSVLLAACSINTPKPGGASIPDRQQYLLDIDAWSFSGRLAISDGKDGGSGNVDWSEANSETKISFRGALGRGAWQLESDPSGALLQTGKGESYTAPDATTLVSRHVGWHIPMDAMPYWVLGIAAPQGQADIDSGENGLPVKLSQQNWEISYDRWDSDHSPPMPVRITASRDTYSFKLVVRKWNIPAPH